MQFKSRESKDLAFDPTKVGSSCAGRFTYSDAGDWRWMTTEENATFEAKEAVDADQTFDVHRHDDDGFGGAVGHATAHAPASLASEGNTSDIGGYVDVAQDVPDDNDLGKDWGKVSLADAYKVAKGSDMKRVTKGKDALAEFAQVIETAQKMLAESAADPLGTRFALIQYRVEGTNPETLKGGKVTGTTALHTIGEQAIIDYATMLVVERLERIMGDDIGGLPSVNSLEI